MQALHAANYSRFARNKKATGIIITSGFLLRPVSGLLRIEPAACSPSSFCARFLSISGLHVALVAAFFFGATRWILKLFPYLLLRVPLSKTSALVAVVPVIFYTFIAGLGVAMAWEDHFAKDGIQNGTAESMEMDAPVMLP